MTSLRLSTYARIAFVAAAAGVLMACAPVRHHPEPAPYYAPSVVYHDYWYYPAIGCYYDPRARMYIYYEHDHWTHARVLPAHARPHLGHHVIVRSQHNRPYEGYPRHREQYTPERYRKSESGHRRDDVWVGPPRQSTPPRDRHDEPRSDRNDRERSGKDFRSDSARGPVPMPPQYRATDPKYPRQRIETRSQDSERSREPRVDAAPVERDNRVRQQELHRTDSRDQHSKTEGRREDARVNDSSAPSARQERPEQRHTADTQDQRPSSSTGVRNDIPQNPAPAAAAAPAAGDQGRDHKPRKESVLDRVRDEDVRNSTERQDADIDSGLWNRRRGSDEYIKDYR